MAEETKEFGEIPEKKQGKSIVYKEAQGIKNTVIKIRNYLFTKYEFRFNTIMGDLEYRIKPSDKWVMLDDRSSYNITNEIILDLNFFLSKDLFKVIMYSEDMAPDYNPFTTYLQGLAKWNPGEKDYIAEFLTEQVTLSNGEKMGEFIQNFKKWFVALIAGLFENAERNQTCLVLVGKQGKFKTTFLNSIVPEQMRLNYLYSAKFNPQNKDHELYLATKLVINIDELATFNRTDVESMKTTITQDKVVLRRAYGRMDVRMWRHASFCGSINKGEFLTDFTGSRRFLVLEVEDIKISKTINLDRMYAQGLALLKQGFQYWFDNVDIQKLEANNEQFQQVTMEEELILKHYSVPSEEDRKMYGKAKYKMTSDIAMDLSQIYNKINVNESYKQKIGLAMAKNGFPRRTKRLPNGKTPVKVWEVVIRERPADYQEGEPVF